MVVFYDSPMQDRMTTEPPQRALLSTADRRQLGGLMFVARRMVEGLYAGRHRSPRRGHSTEFYDYRPYLAGDEVRRIDWRLWARTDRLYVRRYRHDAELTIHLLVDRSASMGFDRLRSAERGGPAHGDANCPTKFRYAGRLAAALAFLAVRQADRVSLTWIGERAEPAVAAGGSWRALQQVIAALEAGQCAGRTDPAAALRGAFGAMRSPHTGRALVVLISDLLDEPREWLAGLSPFLHAQFDAVALQVLAGQELDLGGIGSMRLVDAESGRSVRTSGRDMGRRYRQAMSAHIANLRRALLRHGVDHQLWTTATPPIDALRGYVARRAASSVV